MKYEITDYKNNTIWYDEDDDKFKCDIEFEGKVKVTKRQSLADVKNEIDLFIKANIDFKPIKVFYDRWSDVCIKTISAIRRDNTFVVGEPKNNSYMTALEVKKHCFVYDLDLENEFDALKKEHDEFTKRYHTKKQELENRIKLNPVDVSKYVI